VSNLLDTTRTKIEFGGKNLQRRESGNVSAVSQYNIYTYGNLRSYNFLGVLYTCETWTVAEESDLNYNFLK
jgi:hypothetical protein